jgi:hypothetical protein
LHAPIAYVLESAPSMDLWTGPYYMSGGAALASAFSLEARNRQIICTICFANAGAFLNSFVSWSLSGFGNCAEAHSWEGLALQCNFMEKRCLATLLAPTTTRRWQIMFDWIRFALAAHLAMHFWVALPAWCQICPNWHAGGTAAGNFK